MAWCLAFEMSFLGGYKDRKSNRINGMFDILFPVGQAIKKLKLRKSSPGRARIPPRGSVRKRLQSSQSFMSTGGKREIERERGGSDPELHSGTPGPGSIP